MRTLISCDLHTMASWHGNAFRVIGPLWGESTGNWWISPHWGSSTASEVVNLTTSIAASDVFRQMTTVPLTWSAHLKEKLSRTYHDEHRSFLVCHHFDWIDEGHISTSRWLVTVGWRTASIYSTGNAWKRRFAVMSPRESFKGHLQGPVMQFLRQAESDILREKLPVMWTFDVYLSPNTLLNKHSSGGWSETMMTFMWQNRYESSVILGSMVSH